MTWSGPKSVSMLYASGKEDDRRAVEASFEAAISVGMDYLSAEGFHVRSGRGREKASGMVAALATKHQSQPSDDDSSMPV